jgi:rhodanese-related sulfurtransferase
MRPRPIALLLLPLALAATACTRKTSDRDLVFVTPAQAVEKFSERPGLFGKPIRGVWVDPRRPESYAKEHVAGAISLPLARMEAEAPIALRNYDLFIVYDTDFEDTIGKAASKRLMELGFDDVYTLEGGLKAWKRDGYEVEPHAAPEPPKLAAPAPASAAPSAPAAPAPAAKPATNAPAAAEPKVLPAPPSASAPVAKPGA